MNQPFPERDPAILEIEAAARTAARDKADAHSAEVRRLTHEGGCCKCFEHQNVKTSA
jgi:hypothetical protein